MRVKEAGRGKKGTYDRITPGDDKDLDSGRGRQRGGNQVRDGSHRLARGTTCVRPEREGIADKRCRSAGGGAVQVDGCFAPGQVRGREAGATRERSGANWWKTGEI